MWAGKWAYESPVSAVSELHSQYGKCQEKGQRIGQDNGPFAQENSVDEPANNPESEKSIHPQREGFRVACAESFDGLRHERERGGDGCQVAEK